MKKNVVLGLSVMLATFALTGCSMEEVLNLNVETKELTADVKITLSESEYEMLSASGSSGESSGLNQSDFKKKGNVYVSEQKLGSDDESVQSTLDYMYIDDKKVIMYGAIDNDTGYVVNSEELGNNLKASMVFDKEIIGTNVELIDDNTVDLMTEVKNNAVWAYFDPSIENVRKVTVKKTKSGNAVKFKTAGIIESLKKNGKDALMTKGNKVRLEKNKDNKFVVRLVGGYEKTFNIKG